MTHATIATDTDAMIDFIRTLERGDTFEAKIVTPGGLEMRRLYEVGAQREIGDRNGFVTVTMPDCGFPNNTRRLYVTDEGISVGLNWSPGEDYIEAIASERGTLTVSTYHLEADRDDEGNITSTRVVRDGETNDPDYTAKRNAAADAAYEEAAR